MRRNLKWYTVVWVLAEEAPANSNRFSFPRTRPSRPSLLLNTLFNEDPLHLHISSEQHLLRDLSLDVRKYAYEVGLSCAFVFEGKLNESQVGTARPKFVVWPNGEVANNT
jgi:hypothetical protein